MPGCRIFGADLCSIKQIMPKKFTRTDIDSIVWNNLSRGVKNIMQIKS